MGTTRYLMQRSAALQAVSVQPSEPFHGLEGLKHMPSSIVPTIYDPDLADAQLGAPTEAAAELPGLPRRRRYLDGCSRELV